MSERLDPQYAAALMAAAVAATGPRPRGDKAGRWMKDVLGNATVLHRAITPWGENPSQLERAVNARQFAGVLLSVEPHEKGHRLELTFLPLGGKYAGKWINPREKVPSTGPVPRDYEPGFNPATEPWAGPFINDDGRGNGEWDNLRSHVGRAVWYTAHHEKAGEEGAPKGGYRVFDQIDGPAQVPEDLQGHVDRILRSWKIAPAPQGRPPADEDYDELPDERAPVDDRSAPPGSHTDRLPASVETPGGASGLPDEVQALVQAALTADTGTEVDAAAREALRVALRRLGRRQQPLAGWASAQGFIYDKPRDWTEFTLVADAVARLSDGKELPS